MTHAPRSRRSFLQASALTAAGAAFGVGAPPKLKVGLDNFAVRAMGWKAPRLVEYAAELKCDTILISDLPSFESLEDAYLREVKAKADALNVGIYLGSWSICPSSVRFRTDWGTAEEHLRLGLRAAKTLGSPVFRVILGGADDRKTPGGIRARMADTVEVLKKCRSQALELGVKVAIENHAGDMHSWELADLIDAAGPDFVGANFDSGNAAWTLEDPMDALDTVGARIVCSSLRDDMIWATDEGASVQWTACGDGLLDWKKLAERWAVLCPDVPIMIETISGFARPFAYRKPEFWEHYDRRPERLAKFEALAKRGQKLEPFKAPDGADKKVAEQEYQRAQIERSIRYLRDKVGLGLKA